MSGFLDDLVFFFPFDFLTELSYFDEWFSLLFLREILFFVFFSSSELPFKVLFICLKKREWLVLNYYYYYYCYFTHRISFITRMDFLWSPLLYTAMNNLVLGIHLTSCLDLPGKPSFIFSFFHISLMLLFFVN